MCGKYGSLKSNSGPNSIKAPRSYPGELLSACHYAGAARKVLLRSYRIRFDETTVSKRYYVFSSGSCSLGISAWALGLKGLVRASREKR